MRELIRLTSIQTEMQMLYKDYGIRSIAVEGGRDRRILEYYFPCEDIKIKYVGGWENVVSLISSANSIGENFVIGVIDADFHRISTMTGHEINSIDHIVYTDYHDIEMILFALPAYIKYLRLNANREKISAIADFRMVIIDQAKFIGALRLFSLENELNLWFSEIDYDRFISRRDCTLNLDVLISYILARTSSHNGQAVSINKEAIIAGICAYLKKGYCKYDLCNGHDVLNLIAIAMRSVFASKNALETTEDSIFEALLLALDESDFKNTDLYKSIDNWVEQRRSAS